MGYVVREADLTKDRDEIIALHLKFLSPLADHKRFEWLYCDNPFGEPLVWVVQDSENTKVMGTAAAFPRSMWVGVMRKVAWVLGDFCVSEEYRSLGPALQLQRTCLEGVELAKDTIWYDFPSATMLAIYKRLKIKSSWEMIRFAKPLRVDQKVQSLMSPGLAQKSMSRVGNTVLQWLDRKVEVRAGLTFQIHEGDCGQEFTELSESIGGTIGNCLERTASYLNWRYGQNPLQCCEIMTARIENMLRGYAVFSQNGTGAIIMDLFAADDQEIILGLVNEVVNIVRERGVERVDVSIVQGHPWITSLESLGFRARDTIPVIMNNTIPASSSGINEECEQPLPLVMQGDRDM